MQTIRLITLLFVMAFPIYVNAIEDGKICNEANDYGIMDWIIVGGESGDLFVVMEKDGVPPDPLGRFKRYVPNKYERLKDLITQAYLLSYSVCFDEQPTQTGQSAIVAIYIKAS